MHLSLEFDGKIYVYDLLAVYGCYKKSLYISAHSFVNKVATSTEFQLHSACVFPNWKWCHFTDSAYDFIIKVWDFLFQSRSALGMCEVNWHLCGEAKMVLDTCFWMAGFRKSWDEAASVFAYIVNTFLVPHHLWEQKSFKAESLHGWPQLLHL